MTPPASPASPRRRLPLAPLALCALTACSGGCEEPEVRAPQATVAEPAPAEAPAPAERKVPALTAELEQHLGLQLAARDAALVAGRVPVARGEAFRRADLDRRFWLSVGPRGVRANERDLLPPGPVTVEGLLEKLATAIPDWQDRAGVEPKAAVLIVDAGVEPAALEAAQRALSSARSWRLSLVLADDDGLPSEVPLPTLAGR